MSEQPRFHKFKNYSLNLLIIVFAVLTIYFAYSFVMHMTAPSADTKSGGISSDTSSIQSRRPPPRQTLQIEVRNGCGVQGIAGKFTDFLRANGFDVVETGNFSKSDINKTMVIDRVGEMKNAKKVAAVLGVAEKYVIQQINRDFLLDATVVIGADYSALNPFKDSH